MISPPNRRASRMEETWAASTTSSMPMGMCSSRLRCGTLLDPQYRERAPKLVKDKDGKERLLLEDKILGSRAGFGGIGGVGARRASRRGRRDGLQGRTQGRLRSARAHPRHGSRRHRRRLPLSQPRPARRWRPAIRRSPPRCRVLHPLARRDYREPYPDRLFGIAMLPMQSIDAAIQEMRSRARSSASAAASCGPTPTATASCMTRTTSRSGPARRAITCITSTRALTAARATVGTTASTRGRSHIAYTWR